MPSSVRILSTVVETSCLNCIRLGELYLEHCVQIRSHSYRKDDIKLEKEQKLFTRMSPGFEGLGDIEKLDRLDIFPLSIGG